MKSLIITVVTLIAALMAPAVAWPQADDSAAVAPISQPLVREGALAVRLADVLGLGLTSSEAEAESLLATAGIAPRNGWIADYPVTPDIVGELRAAVAEAADAGRLTADKDSALKAFDDVIQEYKLAIRPDSSGRTAESGAGAGDQDTTVINNYYYTEGPPVVTYYAPPPAYAYLYTWVPYPFWWWDYWFPGYYVLVDFHKVIVVHKHREVITNHVYDHGRKRFFSINPAARAHDGRFTGNDRPRVINPGLKRTDKPWFSQGERRASTNINRPVLQPSGKNRIGPPSGDRFYGAREGVSKEIPFGGRTYRPAPDRRTYQPAVMPRATSPSGGGKFYSPARSYNPPGGIYRAPQKSFTPSDGGRTFYRSGGGGPVHSGGRISAPGGSGSIPFGRPDGGRGGFYGKGRR